MLVKELIAALSNYDAEQNILAFWWTNEDFENGEAFTEAQFAKAIAHRDVLAHDDQVSDTIYATLVEQTG